MKTLYFKIKYHTYDGESLKIVYSVDGTPNQSQQLKSLDGSDWNITLQIPDNAQHIRYAYQVIDSQGDLLRIEPNSWRFFQFDHRSQVMFCDAWAVRSLPTMYHRSAFSQCIMLPREGDQLHLEHNSAPCLLILHALPPTDGYKWAVVGNTPEWGEWNLKKARLLHRSNTYEWVLPLNRLDFEQGVEYKYVLLHPHHTEQSLWEEGNNRSIDAGELPARTSAIRQDEMPLIPQRQWKGVGCVIPVFSLRSEESFGVGDFGDLRVFVRWASETGLKAVQLLPINDTTRTKSWRDSYPYNGISVFALHPIYLNPREWRNSLAYKKHYQKASVLNKLPELDYEKTYELKELFTHDLFNEIGYSVLHSSNFKQFVDENAHWLVPYARFCALRDHFATANFRDWPYKDGEPDAPELVEQQQYYRFVQFLLHRQMETVHADARQLGVLLKGDIPIGICPDSVPAWVDGHLFHFNGQAGAPPDDFARNGQNWGFPTYNWEEMAKDNYLWWRLRLQHMERYFDAYRIDHVLGFFRIWEVPTEHIYGILGHFRPAMPYSADELRQMGFTLDPQNYTIPTLSKTYAQELTHTLGDAFITRYFDCTEQAYTLKPDYRSQRMVTQLLPEGTEREQLLDIISEVLFIADPDRPNHYHPRIQAQETRRFAELDRQQQNAFYHLHNHFFYERHNAFWAEEAMKKIPAVTQSHDSLQPELMLYPLKGDGMLACAEDLGMVPASVKGVLERLGILSLEIQRMPKQYGVKFSQLEYNPYLSVATIATHDMPPFRLWWQKDRQQTQFFWNEALKHSGEAPKEASPEICEDIVAQHMASPSMLCLLGLQDLLAISPTLRNPNPEKEQINDPANPNQNWNYRMHLTIEELIQNTAFSEKLRGLIKSSQQH